MIRWDEVQRETESMLDQVRSQMAVYRKRIDELETETAKLTATIAVARQMQEGGYANTLNPQSSLPATPTQTEDDDKDRQLELVGSIPSTQVKRNWQKGIDALSEIPDLPPAIGLTRQPNKSNTSYRAAALLKMEDREMDIAEIIKAFEVRGWVDSDWARPRDAITIAVKRSEKYGWTHQTGKNTYVYSPRHVDEDGHELMGEGDDLL